MLKILINYPKGTIFGSIIKQNDKMWQFGVMDCMIAPAKKNIFFYFLFPFKISSFDFEFEFRVLIFVKSLLTGPDPPQKIWLPDNCDPKDFRGSSCRSYFITRWLFYLRVSGLDNGRTVFKLMSSAFLNFFIIQNFSFIIT